MLSPFLSWLLILAIVLVCLSPAIMGALRDRARGDGEEVELLPEGEADLAARHARAADLANERRLREYGRRLAEHALTPRDELDRRCARGLVCKAQLAFRPLDRGNTVVPFRKRKSA